MVLTCEVKKSSFFSFLKSWFIKKFCKQKSLKNIIKEDQPGDKKDVHVYNELAYTYDAIESFLNLIYLEDNISLALENGNVAREDFRKLLFGTAYAETAISPKGEVIFRSRKDKPAKGVFQITQSCINQVKKPTTAKLTKQALSDYIDFDTITINDAVDVDKSVMIAGIFYIWILLDKLGGSADISTPEARSKIWKNHYNAEAGVPEDQYIKQNEANNTRGLY